MRGNPTSGAAAALVQSFFADAALRALRTAQRATGAAAFLAGGAFALFAFARPGAGAGSICRNKGVSSERDPAHLDAGVPLGTRVQILAPAWASHYISRAC